MPDLNIGYIAWEFRLVRRSLRQGFVLPCITLCVAFVNKPLAEPAHIHAEWRCRKHGSQNSLWQVPVSDVRMYVYVQMHQHPMDHHDHVSQPLNQVAQQPMPHQPIAIDHHHMQQLQPLSQQLQMQMHGQPQQLQMQDAAQQLQQHLLEPQQHLQHQLHEPTHQQYQPQMQDDQQQHHAQQQHQQHMQQHMQEPLPSMVAEIKSE